MFETGIDNLTTQEVPMLVHLGKEKTKHWPLVRLKDDGISQQESSR